MAQQYRIGTTATTHHHDIELGKGDCTYHNTQVVSWERNKKGQTVVTLDSGGWKTQTTKTRMNQCARQYGLKFSVSQRNFKWYVDVTPMGLDAIPHTLDFSDGMQFRLG